MSGRPLVAILLTGFLAAGCNGSSPGSAGPGGDGLQVVASFYPLEWVARQVAGDAADVESLTRPGVEPHDLELAPQDVAKISEADLVVYLAGFQPAVDDAVRQEAGDRVYDVSADADVGLAYTPLEEVGEEHAAENGDHAHTGEDTGRDPHFWLDPLRLGAVAKGLAARLASLDPQHARDYHTNAESVQTELAALHRDFKDGLRECASTDLVTSHNAFGYLADRYGLRQVGIAGLTAEEEPTPADLARVGKFVKDNDVRTIYYETLVSPDVAKAVAAETGATTDVLDPIEGLTRESQGEDYLDVMRSNLTNLRKGLRCG